MKLGYSFFQFAYRPLFFLEYTAENQIQTNDSALGGLSCSRIIIAASHALTGFLSALQVWLIFRKILTFFLIRNQPGFLAAKNELHMKNSSIVNIFDRFPLAFSWNSLKQHNFIWILVVLNEK